MATASVPRSGEGKIVLVAGFQGFSRDTMEITTLGRGGTDATAVALAAALGGACEIYSDVPGVFTADPRIVPNARKLAVDLVRRDARDGRVGGEGPDAPLRRARAEPRGAYPCTIDVLGRGGNLGRPITREMEHAIISAVTHSETDVVFTLTGIPDRPGVAAMIFDRVARGQVNVDTIIQNVVHGNAEMSFSVPAEDVPATRTAIAAAQDELGAFSVEDERRASARSR